MREGSHHPPLLRTPNVVEEPPETPVPSVIVTESDHSMRNIWADHRARRAMFPTRQRTMQPDDDDEDIYQMFVPTEPSPVEPEVPSESSEATSSPKTARPCSWHVEQVPVVQVDPPPSGGRVLRRASSAGEKTTEARQSPDDGPSGNLDVIHTESSSNDLSGSSSAEQLTMDDIENVYDNISYEDLKSMGLVRRDPEESQTRDETFVASLDSMDQSARVQNASEGAEVRGRLNDPEASSESNRSSSQQGRSFGTCDLKIVEENIYDTICFREPLSAELTRMSEEDKLKKERDSLLASEQDLTESLRGFLSEESLHFGDDEGPDSSHHNLCSSELDYSSSSASETFSQRSQKKDKMSERVDEIWNDLENYIKNNEKKADRLPAAFPISVTESPKKSSSNKNSPAKSSFTSPTHSSKPPPITSTPSFTIPIIKLPDLQDEDLTSEESHSPVPTPHPPPATPEPPPGTVKNIRNRLARLSSGSFRLEDDDLVEVPQKSPQQKDNALKDLSGFFPGELAGLDSPLASPSLLLGESVDFPLELMDKSKSRVFLMARQYSQKIKKANQLLRMRSMDPGDSCTRARAEKKQKDLAAILEEKKQGGAAIGSVDFLIYIYLRLLVAGKGINTVNTFVFSFITGARIAEYSQLYDQVMFKSPSGGQTSTTRHQSHPGLPSSPSMPETSLEEDWLHSTYSNGELARFVSSPSETDEGRGSSTHHRLASSFSIPSFQTFPPAPASPPSQRWSMTTRGEKEEHVYSSIKRNPSFKSPSLPSSMSLPAGECQSVSFLSSSQQENNQAGPKSHGPAANRHCSPGLGHTGRQSSLPERSTQGQSDLTLHDGQQVVILNRSSGLSVVSATQNYLANFKDNGEDDDDYVEIRSEDESEKEQDKLTQRVSTSADSSRPTPGLAHSRSLPCTPVRSCGPLRSLDREELEKYMWNESQHSQPTIVQSLREKFQCLSSSSFA